MADGRKEENKEIEKGEAERADARKNEMKESADKKKKKVDGESVKEGDWEENKDIAKAKDIAERSHRKVKEDTVERISLIELLSGGKVLDRICKQTNFISSEKLTSEEDPSLVIEVVERIPIELETLTDEYEKERFIEKQIIAVDELTFKDFPMQLGLLLDKMISEHLLVLRDTNKQTMNGFTSFLMDAIGIDGVLKNVIVRQNSRLDLFRRTCVIRECRMQDRSSAVYGNAIGVAVLVEVGRTLRRGVDFDALNQGFIWVDGSSRGKLRDFRYKPLYCLPFDDPFGLCRLLMEIGYVVALRMEGIEQTIMGRVTFESFSTNTLLTIVMQNMMNSSPMKTLVQISYNDNVRADIDTYVALLSMLGYFKIHVNFDEIQDPIAAALVALICKCCLTYSRVTPSESMIEDETQMKIDNIIINALATKGKIEWDGNYNSERPFNGIVAKEAGRRRGLQNGIDMLATGDAGEGWLNFGGLMRGVSNAQEERYGCEPMPYYLSRDCVNFCAQEEGIFTHWCTRQATVFYGARIVADELLRSAGDLIIFLCMHFVKFLYRLNDYHYTNYASGFRMTSAELNEFNENRIAARGELQSIDINAKSIFYFFRCRKDDEISRAVSYHSQVRREASMMKDLNNVCSRNVLVRRIRDHLDPDRLIWSNGDINAYLGKFGGKLNSYIQIGKASGRKCDYPDYPLEYFGVMGRLRSAVLNQMQNKIASLYVNASFILKTERPIKSLESVEELGKIDPIIYHNVSGYKMRVDEIVTARDIMAYARDRREVYELAIRGQGEGIQVNLPVILKVSVGNGYDSVPRTLRVTNESDRTQERLCNMIEMDPLKLVFVIFKETMVRNPNELVADVVPIVLESATEAPFFGSFYRFLGNACRGDVVYVTGDEQLASAFSS